MNPGPEPLVTQNGRNSGHKPISATLTHSQVRAIFMYIFLLLFLIFTYSDKITDVLQRAL